MQRIISITKYRWIFRVGLFLCLMMVLPLTNIYAAPKYSGPGIGNNGQIEGISIDIYSTPYTDAAVGADSAYGEGGCTWFVAGRVRELTGKTVLVNGADWWYNKGGYSKYGFSRSSSLPRNTKSIICVNGHVGIVEYVYSDQSIVVSEGGYKRNFTDVNGNWHDQSEDAAQYVGANHDYCVISKWSSVSSYTRTAGGLIGFVDLGIPFGTSTPIPPSPEPADTCNCTTNYAGTYKVTGTSGSLAINSGHGTASAGFTQLGSIPEGATITITKASGYYGKGNSAGHWGHVTYGGVSGYCAMNFLTKVDTTPSTCSCSTAYAGTYRVSGTDGSLAINNGHGSSSAGFTMLGSIPEGATITISKATGYNGKGKSAGNWGHVTYNGVTGYCAMNFLVRIDGSCSCSTSYAGYYKVKNTDGTLAINDGHGYGSGYTQLGSIPEDTIVYVSKATGYNGLGQSSGNWGHVTYNGVTGYSAMNYLEKQTTYTLSFNANGGSINISSVSVCVGVTDNNNVADAGPVRSNYTFLGWYTAASGGTQVYNASGRYVAGTYWTSGGAYNYSGSLTLYAHWQQNVIYPSSVGLNSTSLTMHEGDTATLTASISPSNATNKNVAWSTSNTAVVSVSSGGVVTARGIGTAVITCRAVANDSVKATCTVTVSPILPVSISMGNEQLEITIGDEVLLPVSISPANATDQTVIMWIDDESVVKFTDTGLLALDSGTTTIWARSAANEDLIASCTVTVNSTIQDINLNRNSITLATGGIGTTFQLKAAISPDGDQGTIHWQSANPEIALVSDDGLVTAQGAGSTRVYASVVNGPQVSCLVRVQEDMSLMTLPSQILTVEDEAFVNTKATRIVLPSGLETIGSKAFADSSALRFVSIPNSVTSIAPDAFSNDSNLCMLCGHGSVAEEYAINHNIDYLNDESAAFVFVRSVSLPDSFSLSLDETAYLDVSILPGNASNPMLSWSSSNPDIISVSEDGAMTALSTGTAVITAEAMDGSGKTASCNVTVAAPDVTVTEVKDTENSVIDCTEATFAAHLVIGGVPVSRVQKAGITLFRQNGQRLKGNMSDPVFDNEMLYINESTADLGITLEPATTYIYRYAVIVSGITYYSENYSFTTLQGYPRIRFEPDTITMSKGDEHLLSPIIEFTDHTDVAYRVSNSSIAYEFDGVLYAEKTGTVIITAYLVDDSSVKATLTVNVVEDDINYTMSISDTSLQLRANEGAQLNVSISPPTQIPIQWITADESIATVSNGAVMAKQPGRTIITASIPELGLSRSCDVLVKGIQISSISLCPTSLSLTVGDSEVLTADVSPENAYNKTLVWSSSDLQIATVSQGTVEAISAGSATITVEATDGSGVFAQCFVTVSAVSDPDPDPQPLSCGCSTDYAGNYIVTGTDGTLAINDGHGWGTGYTQLGVIPEGATVYVSAASGPSGVSGNWGHVTYNGITGFSAMRYLSPAGEEIDTSSENVNSMKISKVIERANAWADYTWTANVEIPVYNNEYSDEGVPYQGVQYWYPAETIIHGIPYTLANSKYTLSNYPNLSDTQKATAVTFVYSGVTMWGPKYGGDCSCLANDVLWYADPAIGHDGQTYVSTAKAHLYAKPDWNDIAPGDLLAKTGHVLVVIGVDGNNLTIVESRGNGDNIGALHCPNKTVRAAGGYYVCGVCEYCNGSKKCGAIRRTAVKSTFKNNGYTVYRYKMLYTDN